MMGHDKIGPREQALREMREAKFAKRLHFDAPKAKAGVAALKEQVAVAAKKTGKSRKRKNAK